MSIIYKLYIQLSRFVQLIWIINAKMGFKSTMLINDWLENGHIL
jgi:hypothetical protein